MSDEYENDQDAQDAEVAATNQIVRRGFGEIQLAGEGPATQALVAKATADIQSRWIMAMKRPRNELQVRQDLKVECQRPAFAAKAMYAVPRGGKKITGLSIRFAEVALRTMGNMACEAQTLFDSDEERVIRVTATDFETNATWSRDLTVKKTKEKRSLQPGERPIRTRINSYGEPVYIVEATDDDITMKEAAAISKAARTAILRLIPANLQSEMQGIIERTMTDKAAKDPQAEMHSIVDGFAGLNVSPEQLVEYLEHPLEQSTPTEIVELRQIYIGIRDGDVTWTDLMKDLGETRKANRARAAQTVKAARAQAANGAPAPAPANDAPPPPPDTRSQAPGKGAASTKDKIRESKEKAAQSRPVASEVKSTEAPKQESKPAESKPAESKPAPSKPNAADIQAMIDSATPDDWEMRNCFTCGVDIEVVRAAPGGATCKTNCGGNWSAV